MNFESLSKGISGLNGGRGSFASLARVALLLFAAACGAAAAPAPVRILPLGDSITTGIGAAGGYRAPLYAALVNAGYAVDFVGTRTSNPAASLPDSNHEGRNGYRIDQLDAGLSFWLEADPDPDVVLLLIGTNDFAQNRDIANAPARLENLIARIAVARPYARIIVSNLLLRTNDAWTDSMIQSLYNPFIPGIVARQAALGRKVSFVDLRSLVGAADLMDGVHPNQSGYNKMAAGWFNAVRAVIAPEGAKDAPAIYRAVGQPDGSSVCVYFTKPVSDSSDNSGRYSISGGLRVFAGSLDPVSKRVVTLRTSRQVPGASYTISVDGVTDRLTPRNRIAPNTTVQFVASRGRGAYANVPEAANYALVYSMALPDAADFSAQGPVYQADNSRTAGLFRRVAYYLELSTTNTPVRFVWVSMDAFTQDKTKLGVPTAASGALFWQGVNAMNIVSTVPGVANGTGLSGGRIEFTPGNYLPANSLIVPGASDSLYDFGDTLVSGGNYGSMQIHNVGAAQTVLALNSWGGAGGSLDLGIGNCPVDHPDWTFSHVGQVYPIKSLQVFVRP